MLVVATATSCSSEPRDDSPASVAATPLTPIYHRLLDDGIGSAAVSVNGRVFVSATFGGMIRVLDTKGDSVGTIGRPGDGPCEFRSITDFVPLNDSVVAIAEARSGRLQICNTAGGPGLTLLVPGRILAPTAAGSDSIVFASTLGPDSLAILRVAHANHSQGFVRVDTLALWRLDSIASRLGTASTPMPIMALRRDGAVVVAGGPDSSLRIVAFARPQGAATIVDTPDPPVWYTEAELLERRDWIQRTIERTMRRSGRPIAGRPVQLSDLSKIKPRFSWKSLAVDTAGAVWARPASVQDSVVPILVFGGGATAVRHRFLVAAPVRDIAIAGEFLATFGEDSEGRGVVALYRIPTPL